MRYQRDTLARNGTTEVGKAQVEHRKTVVPPAGFEPATPGLGNASDHCANRFERRRGYQQRRRPDGVLLARLAIRRDQL